MTDSGSEAVEQIPEDIADMFSEVPHDEDQLEVEDSSCRKKSWMSSAMGWVGSGVSKVAGKLGLTNSTPREDPQRLASILQTRHHNASPKGGMSCADLEIVKRQREVAGEIVKQVGKNVIAGRDLLTVTFPVRSSAPISMIEYTSRQNAYGPIFMNRASTCVDPVERMRLIMTWNIACQHTMSGFLKPFNPVIGETYQGRLSDGTMIFAEQTSHHPPVQVWNVQGPGGSYVYSGWMGYSAKVRFNKVCVSTRGDRMVTFPDGGCVAIQCCSTDQYVNIMYGDIRHETLGTCRFIDAEHGLVGVYRYATVIPSDIIVGHIERDSEGEVSSLYGSWLSFVEWNGSRYWDITQPAEMPQNVPESDRLPSDCSFRRDICLMKEGRMHEAQEQKTVVEDIQRQDRKLRKAAANS